MEHVLRLTAFSLIHLPKTFAVGLPGIAAEMEPVSVNRKAATVNAAPATAALPMITVQAVIASVQMQIVLQSAAAP
jgi:hypothetical protein